MSTNHAFELDSIVQRVPHVRFEAFDDEMLAIDGEAGYCYSLNEVAGRVWQLLETPTTPREVCQKLSPLYAVDSPTIQNDVIELVQQLMEYGLLRVVAAPA